MNVSPRPVSISTVYFYHSRHGPIKDKRFLNTELSSKLSTPDREKRCCDGVKQLHSVLSCALVVIAVL